MNDLLSIDLKALEKIETLNELAREITKANKEINFVQVLLAIKAAELSSKFDEYLRTGK